MGGETKAVSWRFITYQNHVSLLHVCLCMHVSVYLWVHVFRHVFFAGRPTHLCSPSLLGTASPQMLLTPRERSYSSFVRFPQGVFFLLFNQGLDPMLRSLFSCETRPCRPRLTTRILNRVSCSLTNELCSNTNRIGHWKMSTGTEKRRRNNAW